MLTEIGLGSLEGSLGRLGLDTVDVVYLHDPDSHWGQASTEGIATLTELRAEGTISAIGVGMNQSAMLADFVTQCDVDIVMLAGRYTLLDQSALDDLLPLALERGVAVVAVVAAGVYNSGLLAREVVDENAHFQYRPAPPEMVARAKAIAEICGAHGVTLPQAAVQFPLRHPAVVSAVLGVRDAREAAGGVERSGAPIPEDLWLELESTGLVRT